MIIRRYHTANFTTIGNELFEDKRLAADELGILCYLLSRPDSWEVRRPALSRRFDVGPYIIKRVLDNLIKLGWCHARKVRGPTGTFQIIYEIRDHAGRELSEEEVRRALSLESSEVAPECCEDETCRPDTGDPPPNQPGVVQPGVADHGVVYRETHLTNTDSINTESTKGGRDFEEVKKIWPDDHCLSRAVCEGLHQRLSAADQAAAAAKAAAYLEECRQRSRKVCDLATYYRERRWERLASPGASNSKFFVVRPGTAQAMRWRAWIEVNEPMKLSMFDRQMRRGTGYTVASEWPLGRTEKKPTAVASGESIVPAPLNEADIDEFTNGH